MSHQPHHRFRRHPLLSAPPLPPPLLLLLLLLKYKVCPSSSEKSFLWVNIGFCNGEAVCLHSGSKLKIAVIVGPLLVKGKTSRWSKWLLFLPGAITFGLGTWQIFRRQEKVMTFIEFILSSLSSKSSTSLTCYSINPYQSHARKLWFHLCLWH